MERERVDGITKVNIVINITGTAGVEQALKAVEEAKKEAAKGMYTVIDEVTVNVENLYINNRTN